MPQFTQQQANQFYHLQSPEEKARVDEIGGPSVEWFTNAYNAGVPKAVSIGGGQEIADEAGYSGVRSTVGADNSLEWLGNRKPTPRELRAWAPGKQDEDFNRFDDRTLAKWINEKWDIGRGGFFTTQGARVGKPIDAIGGYDAYGSAPGRAGGGGGRRITGGPPVPPEDPIDDSYLQRRLLDQAQRGGGFFGEGGLDARGDLIRRMRDGGIWWADRPATPAAVPPATPPNQPPAGNTAFSAGQGQGGFGNVGQTLANAFPSPMGAAVGGTPSGAPQVAIAPTPGLGGVPATGAGMGGLVGGALTNQLQKRLPGRNPAWYQLPT